MALDSNIITLVHFMAYPGPGATRSVQRGEAPAKYMIDTIKKVADDPYFGGIEITRIKNKKVRAEVARILAESGMEVTFSAQPIQLINEDGLIAPEDISSADEVVRRQAVTRLKEFIDEAYELGAVKFGVISGADPGTADGLRAREAALEACARSLDELCKHAVERARALGVEPLVIALEMFDRLSEPGCKGQLVGPSSEAIRLAQAVRSFYGNANFGLLYDLSHMLLLKDISFDAEDPGVLKLLAPFLVHVHIGTCVLDKEDPRFGDTHPAFSYPGSAVTPDMLAQFVAHLQSIEYQGTIGFEVMPHGSEISESIVDGTKSYFDGARNRIDVNYVLGSYYFQTRRFFTEDMFSALTSYRIKRSALIEEAAKARSRRENLTGSDGKLVILAADHPARYVTSVGDEPVRMGDRMDYLGRVLRVLAASNVDGVMGTPDIIEDLLIVDYLLKDAGEEGLLDGRVVLGCMNRSGLAGVEYEMDDRMTAFTAERIAQMGLDGAKMMFRIDPGHMSRYSIYTIKYCADAINDCARLGLPVFLEPLPVRQTPHGYQVVMDPDALIKSIGAGSALGETSAHLWLKIPYVPEYDRVVRATSLPVLMLGGASQGNPITTIENFRRGMAEGSNVRGAMVGRNVLYPGVDDPAAVAEAVNKVVHEDLEAVEAVRLLAAMRGSKMDALAPLNDYTDGV